MSAARDAGALADDADSPPPPSLSHLAALVREMRSASLPIAQIAQQQAQRRNSRLAA